MKIKTPERKFRIWRYHEDEEYSLMIESQQGVYGALRHCLRVAAPPGFSDCDNKPHTETHVLMQYTNKLDKKQKEIFELDVVKITPKDEKGFIATIIYEDGCFFEDNHGTPLFLYVSEEIEVIGNTFTGIN